MLTGCKRKPQRKSKAMDKLFHARMSLTDGRREQICFPLAQAEFVKLVCSHKSLLELFSKACELVILASTHSAIFAKRHAAMEDIFKRGAGAQIAPQMSYCHEVAPRWWLLAQMRRTILRCLRRSSAIIAALADRGKEYAFSRERCSLFCWVHPQS